MRSKAGASPAARPLEINRQRRLRHIPAGVVPALLRPGCGFGAKRRDFIASDSRKSRKAAGGNVLYHSQTSTGKIYTPKCHHGEGKTRSVARQLDRALIDKTGLKGLYDIRLKWNPSPTQISNAALDQPILSTAIEEQLGLKLESARGPVEVVVIDSVSKPAEN